MPAGTKKKRAIKSDLADREERLTGETVRWGDTRRDVYAEEIPQSKLARVIDPDTNRPMHKRGPTGNPLSNSFHTHRVTITDPDDPELKVLNGALPRGQEYIVRDGRVYLRREYILVDRGNGIVEKNYAFRPDPEEAKRKARESRRERLLDSLLERLERGELDLDADAEAAEAFGPDEPEDADASDADEDAYPVHKGFGSYELSDGTVLPRGTGKEAALEAEAELHGG